MFCYVSVWMLGYICTRLLARLSNCNHFVMVFHQRKPKEKYDDEQKALIDALYWWISTKRVRILSLPAPDRCAVLVDVDDRTRKASLPLLPQDRGDYTSTNTEQITQRATTREQVTHRHKESRLHSDTKKLLDEELQW